MKLFSNVELTTDWLRLVSDLIFAGLSPYSLIQLFVISRNRQVESRSERVFTGQSSCHIKFRISYLIIKWFRTQEQEDKFYTHILKSLKVQHFLEDNNIVLHVRFWVAFA